MKWILRSKGVVAGAGSAMASSGHIAPLSMAVHDLRGDTADDAASVADPYERVSWPHDATPSVLAGDGSLKLPQVKMATVSPGDGRWLLVASDGFTYVVELATGAIQAKVPSAAEEAVVSPQGTFRPRSRRACSATRTRRRRPWRTCPRTSACPIPSLPSSCRSSRTQRGEVTRRNSSPWSSTSRARTTCTSGPWPRASALPRSASAMYVRHVMCPF